MILAGVVTLGALSANMPIVATQAGADTFYAGLNAGLRMQKQTGSPGGL